jgi:DNA polymerase-1
LLSAYLENPRFDIRELVRVTILNLLGLDIGRAKTKTLNFGYVYGQGTASLAERLEVSVDESRRIRKAQMQAIAGVEELNKALKARVNGGGYIQTWGGRQYYVEPPAWSEKYNKWMDFAYKMLNYLVQGSSADITKESIIRYDEARQHGRFMLSVYDENVISVPKKLAKQEALILRDCMMSIELDVPLLSDGEWGPNYGTLEDLVEPEPDLSRWGIPKGWSKQRKAA